MGLFKKVLLVAMVSGLMSACVMTAPEGNQTKVSGHMGLEYQDFAEASDMMVKDILASGLLERKDKARWVLAVSDIINDTTQRIDTDQLTKKMRSSLLRSGRFIVTTAVGLHGPEDAMTAKSRQLKNSKMMNKKTVKKDGRVIAPDLSLSGKIIQRNYAVANGFGSKSQKAEYYIQLTLTNLDDGLAYWENEYPITKQGSNRSASW